ncbi:MAG: DcaP family trimeric outer membrane transporter [Beijerinckiaceae bacterium]
MKNEKISRRSSPYQKSLYGALSITTALVMILSDGGMTAAKAVTNEELVRLIKQQQNELKNLRKEVETLKDRKPSARNVSAGKDTITKGEKENLLDRFVEKGRRPKSFKIPGTEFDLRIGGFAKGDFISRVSGQTTGAQDLFPVTAILTRGGRGVDDRTRVHARESRFHVDVAGPTPFGNFRAFVEADFFGVGGNQVASNSDTFRLRSAYGDLGPLTFGQTWSTFTDTSAYLNTFDFQGPGGQNFIRQGIVRYTHNFGNGFTLAGAVENPESRVVPVGQTGAVSFRDANSPDFVLRARYDQPWGHIQLAGAVAPVSGPTGFSNEVGYAIGLSGSILTPFTGPKNNFRFQGIYSDGASRFLQDFAGGSGSVVVVPASISGAGNNQLELIKGYGGYGGYQHFWTSNIRSTFGAGYFELETPSFVSPATLKSTFYGVGNLIWSPFPEVDLGVEVQYGVREDRDGAKGTATRIQSSAIFRF